MSGMTQEPSLAVVGAAGLVGAHVVERARARGLSVTGYTRGDVDITDENAVLDVAHRHDIVINAAAYTAVDDAETHEAEAYHVNAVGPATLARACVSAVTRLVHLSTDYVFDGTATAPYRESEPLRPVSAYGRTKAAGEWAIQASGCSHLIVRTAWVYGQGARNFPEAIHGALGLRDTIDVVADQIGQPTWALDLAEGVLSLVEGQADDGVYHVTGSGQASWFEFACELATLWGVDPERVQPITSEHFPRPAPRPAWSVLSGERAAAAGVMMRPWQDAARAAHQAGVWGAVPSRASV